MFMTQNNQRVDETARVQALLDGCQIEYQPWPVSGLSADLCRDASKNPAASQQILTQFAPQLTDIKTRYHYLTEDIVSLSPETPNLDDLLAMFSKPHHHTDDEVRFILHGNGIFGIIPKTGEPYEIHVETGDLLIVPAYTRHWFTLKEDREVVAIRIFKTPDGWTALYDPPTNEPALQATH